MPHGHNWIRPDINTFCSFQVGFGYKYLSAAVQVLGFRKGRVRCEGQKQLVVGVVAAAHAISIVIANDYVGLI